MARKAPESVIRLASAGIGIIDAYALRRIAMTLHRWFELECGNGNSHGSWAIEREDNGDGKPYFVHHHYLHGKGEDYTTRRPIPDKETGARKRLAKIMARYPGYTAYVQGDPRGAPLHILRPEDVRDGDDVSCIYTRGIAVYK